MKSIAIHHFPLIVPQPGEKYLYNPVLKKRFKNRPEERVRLRWVEYLLHQTEWPKSRIGFEAPVSLPQEENTLRADLVLYNRDFSPAILVECKAPDISLSRAASQAARYNRTIGAGYICLTNGINDLWFDANNHPADSPVPVRQNLTDISRDENWWSDRGFCSRDSAEEVRYCLSRVLHEFWIDKVDWPLRYLDFSSSFLPVGMNHDYRIAPLDDQGRMAITFLGAAGTASYLVGVLNENGANRGVVTVNLDRWAAYQDGAVSVFEAGVERAPETGTLPVISEAFGSIESLPVFLRSFFD